MKLHFFSITLCIFAALPGNPRSCSREPEDLVCPAPDVAAHPEQFPELCGDTETAVQCVTIIPGTIETVFNKSEQLIESSSHLVTPPGPANEGVSSWQLKSISPDTLRYWRVPRLYGVPVVVPLSLVRSDGETARPDESRMSAYLCTSDIREKCIIDMVTVWSWTARPLSADIFADDYEYVTKVIGARGECPGGLEKLEVGDTWKGSGKLYRPSGCRGGTDPCLEDDWCNPWCDEDLDCDCYHDNICDEFCFNDTDCDCGLDAFCNPACADEGKKDPDCDCYKDGRCNPLCMDTDPDCLCMLDGWCNPACMNLDSDCNCFADGECNPVCGWFDPDCLCVEDGVCNREECDNDPDCGCDEDGVCNKEDCADDPDCRCIEDRDCNEDCEYDPDCECIADDFCNEECDYDPDCEIPT